MTTLYTNLRLSYTELEPTINGSGACTYLIAPLGRHVSTQLPKFRVKMKNFEVNAECIILD